MKLFTNTYNDGGKITDGEEENPNQSVYASIDQYFTAHELLSEKLDRNWGTEIYRNKDRVYQVTRLNPNSVYIFKVRKLT